MAEEFRDDKQFVLAADLPGLNPERDIAVSITADILHIRAERSDGAGVPETDLREGVFTRDIRLPAGTDELKVSARYTEGVLEVRAPMRTLRRTSRQIPVISHP